MSDLMSDRYGTASPARRRLIILVSGVVGVVALAWVAWAAWFQSTPDVQSALSSYHVVDTHTATAKVTVQTRDAEVRAQCIVRAVGADHSVVGEVNFTVTGVKGTVDHDVNLRTERKATSVEMVGCTSPNQARPR